jgi:hypothetical protein
MNTFEANLKISSRIFLGKIIGSQSISYGQFQLILGQKPFNESIASKAVATGENHNLTSCQVNGLVESGSKSENECGCSLAWFCPEMEISSRTHFFADYSFFFVCRILTKL